MFSLQQLKIMIDPLFMAVESNANLIVAGQPSVGGLFQSSNKPDQGCCIQVDGKVYARSNDEGRRSKSAARFRSAREAQIAEPIATFMARALKKTMGNLLAKE